MSDEVCLRCGCPPLIHLSPTWHYEKVEVDGRPVMKPVVDGHFYLSPHEDEDEDEE